MLTTRRSLLLGMAGLSLAAALPARASAAKATIGGRAFATRWRVTLAEGRPDASLERELAQILAAIDAEMSPFRQDSAITRFNRADSTDWIEAPAGLAAVAGAALELARASGGTFDPSVGPAVHRFGFGPVEGTLDGSHRGLDADANALRKSDPRLSLDLCGIAKGHAVDRLAAHLRARGHRDFLVDIGGDLHASGRAPGGRPWRLGIEDPVRGGIQTIVELSGMALATSGDAVHFYEVEGRRYSHVIDPATGRPVANAVASVSVLAPDAMRADALATALMVMGPEKGLAFADRNAVPALFLMREAGGVREAANDLFRARLAA